MKDKKKATPYGGITTEEARLKSEAILKVNGIEVVASEYFKDPQKYNTAPMDPQYVKEVEDHLAISIKTKEKLSVDPNSIKSIL